MLVLQNKYYFIKVKVFKPLKFLNILCGTINKLFETLQLVQLNVTQK